MARKPAGRSNQRYRTRKDLMAAAAALIKSGRKPTLDAVAEEARVSRATAYRYFPSIEALLVEAALDLAAPDIDTLFAGDKSSDPEARIDKAEAAMHRMAFDNETAIRVMLAATLAQSTAATRDPSVPLRQNRRSVLIDAALAPARQRFKKASYAKLRAALALIFGSESMIVFRDVLRLDEKSARDIKSWAARALVRAALEERR
jgi:AcrR family transcriptional regulator